MPATCWMSARASPGTPKLYGRSWSAALPCRLLKLSWWKAGVSCGKSRAGPAALWPRVLQPFPATRPFLALVLGGLCPCTAPPAYLSVPPACPTYSPCLPFRSSASPNIRWLNTLSAAFQEPPCALPPLPHRTELSAVLHFPMPPVPLCDAPKHYFRRNFHAFMFELYCVRPSPCPVHLQRPRFLPASTHLSGPIHSSNALASANCASTSRCRWLTILINPVIRFPFYRSKVVGLQIASC